MKKRKAYEISVIDKTYSKTISDETKFYTSDTALELVFKLKETEYTFESAEIVLLNIDDRSLVTRPVAKSLDGFTYELDDDIIPHYGEWQGQLRFEAGEIYVSSPVKFRIENDLSNERPPQLSDVQSWVSLKRYADSLTEELKQAVLDVDGMDDTFNANESERQTTFETNESERNETFNTNESTRQKNEYLRIEAEQQREGTVAKIESRQTFVENQFNAIQQDLTDKDVISAPEIITARNGEANLKTRLDKEQQEVSTQLADNANFSSPTIANINEKNSDVPIITFIDDDGTIETHTRLLPMFKSKQVPFAGAIITGYVEEGWSAFMDLQQIQECRQNGMEVLSHTVSHYNLADLSPTEVDFELRESKKWLVENQLESEAHVYPQSGQNMNIRKNTRYYYDYAFGDNGFNDLGYLDHSRIKRIGFGSWTDGNPVVAGNSEKNTFAYYKACVDYAAANNLWLVFMIHVKQQSLEQDNILGQLIDYIKSLNISILKPSDAFRIKANKLSVGDLEEQYLYVGESKVATNITSYKRERLNGRNNSSPVTEYKKGYTTIIDVTNADNASFPDGSGALETYRTDLNWEGYSFQTFKPLAKNRTYKRLWDVTTGNWNNWIWIEGESNPIRTLAPNSVNATTPYSYFEDNKITYCLIQTVNAQGFPRNSAGLLIVDKTITVNGFIKQRYHVYNSNEVWERLINPDGTFGEWGCLNPYSRVTINVPKVVVPSNSTVDVTVDLAGLKAGSSQIWGNPAWGLSLGLMYDVMVTAHDSVTIRFANLSDINLTITPRNWMFTYVS